MRIFIKNSNGRWVLCLFHSEGIFLDQMINLHSSFIGQLFECEILKFIVFTGLIGYATPFRPVLSDARESRLDFLVFGDNATLRVVQKPLWQVISHILEFVFCTNVQSCNNMCWWKWLIMSSRSSKCFYPNSIKAHLHLRLIPCYGTVRKGTHICFCEP